MRVSASEDGVPAETVLQVFHIRSSLSDSIGTLFNSI